MKTQSNIAFPNLLKWKDGQLVYFYNHADNGVQPEGQEGARYTADMTIVKGDDIDSVINAFTRSEQDEVFNQQVIDNIEVNGKPAIETMKEYATKVSSAVFPPLPASGWLNQGVVYSYRNGAVMVRQPHERTIYPPEETPALFSFWRDNASEEMEWIVGEKVEEGWKRTYGGKTYECTQPHYTQVDWTPDKAHTLWDEVQVTPDYPVWVQPTGAHDSYNEGDRVHFPTINDPVYESVINANVWSPTAYPEGWKKL